MENRYIRQIAIPEIGKEGQERISRGSVFIIGAGALGSVVAMYLAGAGVGRIGIADFDTIDITNLQRQVFFSNSRLGEKKVLEIARRMKELNPEVDVEPVDKMITLSNGEEIVKGYDLMIDATDNPASKYMTDTLAEKCRIRCVIAGVEGFRGQVITISPGSERYRDLFPEMPEDPGMTPCSVAGVIGPAAGVAASLEAAEALKILSGAGMTLESRLLTFDLLDGAFRTFRL